SFPETPAQTAQPIPGKTDQPNGHTHRRSNRRNKRVRVAKTSKPLILTTTSPRPPTPPTERDENNVVAKCGKCDITRLSCQTGGRRLTPYWGFKGRGWDEVAI